MLDDLRKLSNEYPTIDDRTLAIRHALNTLDNGDGLIVTGKGSEKYKGGL